LRAGTLENAVMDSEKGQNESLYLRLGGYDAIAGIIADLFQAMRNDERFHRFGLGRSLDSRNRAQQLTVELVCTLAGGPCFYLGRDMKTSHSGLGITAEEWKAFLLITGMALDKREIAAPEREEFFDLFERYRAEIVEPSAN